MYKGDVLPVTGKRSIEDNAIGKLRNYGRMAGMRKKKRQEKRGRSRAEESRSIISWILDVRRDHRVPLQIRSRETIQIKWRNAHPCVCKFRRVCPLLLR